MRQPFVVARGRAASATLDDADASYDQGELHELPRSDRAWRGELGASQFLTGHAFKRLELVPVVRVQLWSACWRRRISYLRAGGVVIFSALTFPINIRISANAPMPRRRYHRKPHR